MSFCRVEPWIATVGRWNDRFGSRQKRKTGEQNYCEYGVSIFHDLIFFHCSAFQEQVLLIIARDVRGECGHLNLRAHFLQPSRQRLNLRLLFGELVQNLSLVAPLSRAL